MTATAPGGDVRGFYQALGVELPGWARSEAPVRCFADPDAHRNQDRHASCSVSLESGAFNCHGCGAHGGAYDAALAAGRSPREAIDLMIAHGLAERRARNDNPRGSSSPARACPSSPTAASVTGARTAEANGRDASPPRGSGPPTEFAVDGEQVLEWADALARDRQLLERLRAERGWEERTLRELGVGFDGERITVPIPDAHAALQGVLRLRIEAWQRPKVLAMPGTRLGLTPHPAPVVGPVVLVEGQSDMLAARSAGLSAIAVPGTHAWRAEWAMLFAGREVTVVMDSDRPGRQAAARISADLERAGARARIVELAPGRDDGYDLTDWLRDGNHPDTLLAGSRAREASTGLARAAADVWTVQIAAATPMPRSAVTADGQAAAVVLPPRSARSWGCGRS